MQVINEKSNDFLVEKLKFENKYIKLLPEPETFQFSYDLSELMKKYFAIWKEQISESIKGNQCKC